MNDPMCIDGSIEHNYQFVHVVYSFNDWCLPGSSARERYLEDKFACTRCLHTKYANQRCDGNSFSKAIEGTVPK